MPSLTDTMSALRGVLDSDPDARERYERSVARRQHVLDVGGRNGSSRSAERLRMLADGAPSTVVATDIVPDYEPDVVDDITASQFPDASFDGVNCSAILEHVTDYEGAISEIQRILRDGGEAFFYVPFIFPFHDRMDYHRFTISEVARMLGQFSELKVFIPSRDSGFGFVVWHIATYGMIARAPHLHSALARITNACLRLGVRMAFLFRRPTYSLEDALFFYTYVNVNHGFCAWVRR